MAIHKLKPAFVEKETRRGVYSDGGGLYLRIQGTSKSWIFRFARSRFGGKGEAEMGLGAVHTISMDGARELARQCRAQLVQGIDPLEARRSDQLERQLAAAKDVTFGHCGEEYLAFMSKTWKPSTYAGAKSALEKYVYPKLKNIPISAIDHLQVEEVLKPIWESMPPRAAIVRLHLQALFDRATAKTYRTGDNPASLKGPLGVLLHPTSELHTVKHHPSLPYQEIGAFMAQLRSYKGVKTASMMAAELLQFVILTAVRVGQMHKMRWPEIDWDNRVWVCPSQRTKTGKNHLVPLSTPALAILKKMQTLQKETGVGSDFIFVRALPRPDRYYDEKRRHRQRELANVPLGNSAASKLLERSLRKDDGTAWVDGHGVPITLHGFRTTFSTWANEHGFEHRDIEMALDHTVKSTGGDAPQAVSGVSRVYNQALRVEPRRKLLEAWAEFCGRTEPLAGDIIPFRQAK